MHAIKVHLSSRNHPAEGRLAELPPFEPKVKRGWLARYARFVTSADTGAVLEI